MNSSFVFVLLLTSVLLLGCTGLNQGVDAVSTAQSIEGVQAFLETHPNAKIVTQYLTAQKLSETLKQYPDCSNVDPQPAYFITFKDGDTSAVAFVSVTQQPLCSILSQSGASPRVDPRAEPVYPPINSAQPVEKTPGEVKPQSGYCIPEGQDLTDIGVNGQASTSCCPGLQPFLQSGHESATCMKKPSQTRSCDDLGGVCTFKGDPIIDAASNWPCSEGSREIKNAFCPKDEMAIATGNTVVCCSKPALSMPKGKCAPEGRALNDAVTPDGPTDYLECCPGLTPSLQPGEIAAVCQKPENLATTRPTPTASPIATPVVVPYDYPAELPDSAPLRAFNLSGMFGCDNVRFDLDSSRWLEPRLPLASCTYELERKIYLLCDGSQPGTAEHSSCYREKSAQLYAEFTAQGGAIRSGGGLMHWDERYVVLQNGQPKLLANESQFREVFGPVDSPAEAIAFADLLHHWGISRLLADPKGDFVREHAQYNEYQYFVPEVHGTHAEPTAGGFVVNLFDTFPGHCASGIDQVNFLVYSNGSVSRPPSAQERVAPLAETVVAQPDTKWLVNLAENKGLIACE